MGGKKLAIDSSIWLYQFQIAMRDKEGRALDNAHILGFLRRICKLLFYGIKPVSDAYLKLSYVASMVLMYSVCHVSFPKVFVFDGGAPTIKKVAISNRKNRKQGARESAARTAEKLLAAQLRAAAIKQARKDNARREGANGVAAESTATDGPLNYMDEDYGIAPRGAPQARPRAPGATTSSSPARDGNMQSGTPGTPEVDDLNPKKKKYVHKDQYALPVIEGPISARGAPSDPRLATEAELRSFIEDMHPEDFDMDSEFFANLPVEAKYEIIGDLRIKSRQSNFKRVEAMRNAPTPLDFSRAQIMGLAHRNDLTQKLLTMTDSLSRVMPMSGPVRIAGERNKEYVLIKNDTSEGTGYILGVRGGGETASTPVKIEGSTTEESDLDKASTDEEFEQVAIPQHNVIQKKSSTPEVLERRREMAKEAIRQRYSPVKATRRRGDSPVDDLPALPPQRPLFINENGPSKTYKSNGKAKAKSTSGRGAPKFDLSLLNQISNAVASAEQGTSIGHMDEEEDLQRAIEASKRDMLPYSANTNGQASTSTEESGDESDVSFDEVETSHVAAARSPAKQMNEQVGSFANDGAEDSDDSIEYVRADEMENHVGSGAALEKGLTSAFPASGKVIQSGSGAIQRNSSDVPPLPGTGKAALQSTSLPAQSEPSHTQTTTPRKDTPTMTSPVSISSTTSGRDISLKGKKPLGLHLDIPPAGYRPPSPEKEHGRTPRPDLTEEQAQRDTSPQLVAEHDGIVERDYAPQPAEKAEDGPPKSTIALPETASSPSDADQQMKAAVTDNTASLSVPARPSLMQRTLSNQSGTGRRITQTIEDPEPVATSIVSKADEEALMGESVSVLDEIRAAMPNEEDGVVKGDLQEEVSRVDVASLAVKMNGHDAQGNEDEAGAEKSVEEDKRASSPEIVYEWSQSPEPESRDRPADLTLLPPDDPNYVPTDIDFPEPGHELSDLDDEDQEHLHSLNSEQVEYAKFLAELKSRNLDEMEDEVENELTGLKEQDKRDKKMADDITVQMAKDIQVFRLPCLLSLRHILTFRHDL